MVDEKQTTILAEKIIIVIGGSGLLGSNFCEEIIRQQGICIIADQDKPSADKVINHIIKKYPKQKNDIQFLKTDITSKKSVFNIIKTISKKYKKIDALVNTAYPRNNKWGTKFEKVTYESFCENLNLHLGGYFLASQQFAEYFKKQGWGNIINIASIYGVLAPRFDIYKNSNMTVPVEYSAIKSAIIHLSKYMAKYYKGSNIRFNCISPGGIKDKQPVSFLNNYNKYGLNKGMLATNDISGTLIYLLSDMSAAVNGQNIIVDDGWSL